MPTSPALVTQEGIHCREICLWAREELEQANRGRKSQGDCPEDKNPFTRSADSSVGSAELDTWTKSLSCLLPRPTPFLPVPRCFLLSSGSTNGHEMYASKLSQRVGTARPLHGPHANFHDWPRTLSEWGLHEIYLLGLMSPRSAARRCLGLFPQSGIKQILSAQGGTSLEGTVGLLTNRKYKCGQGVGMGQGKTPLSFMITSGDEDNE